MRHSIDMDGTTHGPDGSGADCEFSEDEATDEIETLSCGSRCVSCGVGVVHWQPVYGGYFYKCDNCDKSGIDPGRLD